MIIKEESKIQADSIRLKDKNPWNISSSRENSCNLSEECDIYDNIAEENIEEDSR